MRFTYTDGHIEYRVCYSRGRAEWLAHMEGDHLRSWEIV